MYETNCLKNNKVEKSNFFKFFCSLVMALYIDIPMINQIVIAIFPSLSGKLMTPLYFICALCVVGVVGYSVIKGKRINIKLLGCLAFIIFAYLLTNIITPYSELSIIQFISYTILAVVIPLFFEIDGKFFLRAVMIYSLLGIFYLEKIFKITDIANQTISMGLSYAFLPTIIVSIVYLVLFLREDTKKGKYFFSFLILVNFIYLLKILQYGSRGPVLSVILCIFFLICFKCRMVKGGVAPIGIKFILLGIGVIILLINIWSLLGYIQTFLNMFDIHISTIDKLIRLSSSSEGISNGRDAIYYTVAQEFLKSPMWGYGISTSMHNIGINYPHNFVLQMLYDGGLLLTIPILGGVLTGLSRILRTCNRNEYAVVSALFFMSVPGAMFSGDLWENNTLWLTFAVLILGKKVRKFII